MATVNNIGNSDVEVTGYIDRLSPSLSAANIDYLTASVIWSEKVHMQAHQASWVTLHCWMRRFCRWMAIAQVDQDFRRPFWPTFKIQT